MILVMVDEQTISHELDSDRDLLSLFSHVHLRLDLAGYAFRSTFALTDTRVAD